VVWIVRLYSWSFTATASAALVDAMEALSCAEMWNCSARFLYWSEASSASIATDRLDAMAFSAQ
jgi:hypothetical protein